MAIADHIVACLLYSMAALTNTQEDALKVKLDLGCRTMLMADG